MSPLHYGLIMAAGIVAGFCNTIAGGGSMLVVPLVIFLGFPGTVANASLRPAILVQNMLALMGFRKGRVLDGALLKRLWLPVLLAVPAAILGATMVVERVDDSTFERILAISFVGLAIFMVLWRPHTVDRSRPFLAGILAIAAGFYGGFIQAGVGFILVSALLLGDRWRMAEAHAAKMVIVGLYTICVLPVFIMSGQIDWMLAICLSGGQGIGAVLGSRFATQGKDELLRRIYIIMMILFAVLLFV